MRTYQKPETEIVLLTSPDVMQGIVTTSGENGPVVDPTKPIDDPDDPGAGLANFNNKLWEE